jgi:hypothetical protein
VNNSLPRLIDGMVATLRNEVIPHVDGDFARGQAYGVIYMLNSLRLRASWSNGFLVEQLRALDDLSCELEPLAEQLAGAGLPNVRAPAELPDAAALAAQRDEGDRCVCELIDWLATNGAGIPPETRAQAEVAIDKYLNRQARFELSTSAKPMFVEMSGGTEKT